MLTAKKNIVKTSRRAILGGSGASLAGVALLASSPSARAKALHPDAEQIRLCEEHIELSLQHHSLFPDGKNAIEGDEERLTFQGSIRKRQQEIEDLLYEIRSKTITGVRARALAAAAYSPGFFEGDDELEASFTNSIIRDLTNLKIA